MTLNPKNVPPGIAIALPFAEKWGIGDDSEREAAIEKADLKELEEIAHCLDDVDDAVLSGWLTGPESQRASISSEYVAVTCLTMAVHSARAKLKKRRNQ
ncbi:MAG: hypothetical protein WC740_06800 [Verrucomicrobiia bacterium]